MEPNEATRGGRLVWIVVDALRGDFVEELRVENAVTFDCMAGDPTITLPRLFALLTGTQPSPRQVLSNFGGQMNMSEEDSLVHRWRSAGKRIVFYGDDTWLRLFPSNVWLRSEGVTSFDVRDTVQVDANVTRGLRHELRQSDWDILILHYLGLDHVGHSLGPAHPRKAEKLAELRQELQRTIKQLNPADLIAVTGDHGMTSEGGHGGATREELSTGVMFVRGGEKGLNRTVFAKSDVSKCFQNDVTATLAIATGVTVPLNCLGTTLDSRGVLITPKKTQEERRLRRWADRAGVVLEKSFGDLNGVKNQLRDMKESDFSVVWHQWLAVGALGFVILSLFRKFDSFLILAAVQGFWQLSSSFAEESHIPLRALLRLLIVVQIGGYKSIPILILLRLVPMGLSAGDKWRYLTPLCVELNVDPRWICLLILVPLFLGPRKKNFAISALFVGWHALAPSPLVALIAFFSLLCLWVFSSNISPESACIFLILIHSLNGFCSAFIVTLCYAVLQIYAILSRAQKVAPLNTRFIVRLISSVFFGALGYSLSISSIRFPGAYTFAWRGYEASIVFTTGFLMISAPQILAATFLQRLKSTGEFVTHRELEWTLINSFGACVSATLQRGHLFVWSVFAPMVAWSAVGLVQFLIFRGVQ